MVNDSASSSEGKSPRQEISYYEHQPPPKKRLHHLESVIQQKWKDTLKKNTKWPPAQIELDILASPYKVGICS